MAVAIVRVRQPLGMVGCIFNAFNSGRLDGLAGFSQLVNALVVEAFGGRELFSTGALARTIKPYLSWGPFPIRPGVLGCPACAPGISAFSAYSSIEIGCEGTGRDCPDYAACNSSMMSAFNSERLAWLSLAPEEVR